MGRFITPYDVANRALQMLGVPRISTFADTSRQASEAGFLYDKARRAELRRFTWTFATRRAILRPVTTTIVNVSFPAYSTVTAYVPGDIVNSGNILYTNIDADTGEVPGIGGFDPDWETYCGALQAELHSVGTTYYPGDLAYVSTTLYRWINAASGLNHVPPNATYWMAPTGATLVTPLYHSPTNFDPPAGASLRNMYRLPANFLRIAPQDPKKSAVARLGTTAGLNYNDWEIENGFLVTSDTSGPLIFRFVSDATIVAAMDDMFCEAVACRMALALNETLTQRADLAGVVTGLYNRFVQEAHAVSAIEGGTTEPDIGGPPEAPQQQPAPRR